jgi:YaiO family outer membrane protein
VRSKGSTGQGDRFMLRYYYQGDADHFVEANASSGRSDDFATTLLTPSRSDARGWSWLHFFNREWGLKASWSESKDNSSGGRERSFNLGATHRW